MSLFLVCPACMTRFANVLCQLFREFDFQLINPAKPYKEELFNTFVVSEVWMRISERKL